MRGHLIEAIGNSISKAQGPDGRLIERRSITELNAALATIEQLIRDAGGRGGNRVGYAEHRRGDSPGGPCSGWDPWR
jgi:hypothetical protein